MAISSLFIVMVALLFYPHSSSSFNDPSDKLRNKDEEGAWPIVTGLKCRRLFFRDKDLTKHRDYTTYVEKAEDMERQIHERIDANGTYNSVNGVIKIEAALVIKVEDDDVLDEEHLNQATIASRPSKGVPSCKEIKHRNNLTEEAAAAREREEAYPIAFSFVVYTDYLAIERLLAFYSRPWNHFCYAIDQKAKEVFKRRVRNLPDCFPNVHVLEREFNTDKNAMSSMVEAFLACMQLLSQKKHHWEYLVQLEVGHRGHTK